MFEAEFTHESDRCTVEVLINPGQSMRGGNIFFIGGEKYQMLKVIPVEEAVGLPLAHDITEIVPGKHKGPAFRRGHGTSGGPARSGEALRGPRS